MNFLRHGYRKLLYYRQTDIHKYRYIQTYATEIVYVSSRVVKYMARQDRADDDSVGYGSKLRPTDSHTMRQYDAALTYVTSVIR